MTRWLTLRGAALPFIAPGLAAASFIGLVPVMAGFWVLPSGEVSLRRAVPRLTKSMGGCECIGLFLPAAARA